MKKKDPIYVAMHKLINNNGIVMQFYIPYNDLDNHVKVSQVIPFKLPDVSFVPLAEARKLYRKLLKEGWQKIAVDNPTNSI